MNIVCQNCAIALELDESAAAEPFDCPSCGSFNDPPTLRPDGTPCIVMRPRPDVAALQAAKAGTSSGPVSETTWRVIMGAMFLAVAGLFIWGVYQTARGESLLEIGSMGSRIGEGLFGILVLLVMLPVGFGAYFLPAIIAARRGHRNQLAILLLNLFLGWTLLGWVVALVWSVLAEQSPAPAYGRR